MKLHPAVLRFPLLAIGVLALVLPQRGLLAQPYEVFRLQAGLRLEYSYQSWSTDHSYGSYTTLSDSGLITCLVIDSNSTVDSTRTWLVQQTLSLVHRRQTNYIDTTYALWDTTTLPLRETITGYHQLQCNSAVWDFPEVHPDNQVTRVYRYADTSRTLTALAFSPWCIQFWEAPHDSLWLSTDSSYSRRSSFHCIDNDEVYSGRRRLISLRSLTVVSVGDEPTRPSTFHLFHPYPNPFNSATTIRFISPDERFIRLRVLDILGREVARVFEGQARVGENIAYWNPSGTATGVYFLILESGSTRLAERSLLLR